MQHVFDALANFKARLRDLKTLYAQGLISDAELKKHTIAAAEVVKLCHPDRLAHPIDFVSTYVETKTNLTLEGIVPTRKANKIKTLEEQRAEAVKDIIADVLNRRLECKRAIDLDAYRFDLHGMIPRELVIQDSIEPIVEYLESLKRGMAKILDDAIKELKSRDSDLL